VEKQRVEHYVASLEQIIKNTHLDLRETMSAFQELCRWVNPGRIVPQEVITGIRKTYKEIQEQLTKIRGVNQLLGSKYRQYWRRDSLRNREILEVEFLAKNLYLKFEYTLQEIQAKRKLRDSAQRMSFTWFHSEENQTLFLRNLRKLHKLDYNTRSDLEVTERREVAQSRLRSFSLFVLSGEIGLMDILQSRMQLREYDIKERYASEELRGLLTHLREIPHSEVERVIKRFTDSAEFSKPKCLLLPIQSQQDIKEELLVSPEEVLRVMAEGEVRTLLA